MNIWVKKGEQKNVNKIKISFDSGVDSEVKRACREFVNWIKKEYFFPKCIRIYFKDTYQIKAKDGENVSAICFLPFDMKEVPYIKISTGDYEELIMKIGKDNALAAILNSLAHELTHYYQWVNNSNVSDEKMEIQAKQCARRIIRKYACTRPHP